MIDHSAKRERIVALLQAGLCTQAEAAALAGVTRQHVQYWSAAASIDVPATRQAMLAKLWQHGPPLVRFPRARRVQPR